MKARNFYIGLAALTFVIVVADIAYFSQLAVAEPAEEAVSQAPAPAAPESPAMAPDAPSAPEAAPAVVSSQCSYDEAIPPVAQYQNLVTFADPFQGNAGSGIQVVEYFDPNCPHCRTMHPIMKRVIETHSDKAQFFMVPFIVFSHSLPQIEALYVAAQDGKYLEMVDAQFEAQKPGGLSVDELAQLAAGMGIDAEVFARRVNRGLNRDAIAARREQARSIGLAGVPTVLINGRVVASASKSVECLQELIDAAAAEAEG
ncbi:MAG: thioredoxin domain-containing protein [Rhodothermales bacterium]|nr:thioredoxin domain-containing protein [Rhodothermales bacterium]MBO6779672.1 thioredoxin domain-containing protein [Rhodothermales bacterium]